MPRLLTPTCVPTRAALLALAALLAAGCGAPKPPPTLPHAGPTPDARPFAARGLPGTLPYTAVVLAGPGVYEIELYGLYYGLVGAGWKVRLATPDGAGVVGHHNLPVPADLALSKVAAEDFDLLVLPGGAPQSPEALALVKAYAVGGHIAVTRGGAGVLAKAGVERALASDDQMVHADRNVLSAARPGDIPALVHALGAYAADRLRPARAEDGKGQPP